MEWSVVGRWVVPKKSPKSNQRLEVVLVVFFVVLRDVLGQFA